MGHVFRAINLARELVNRGHCPLIVINDHLPAVKLLESTGIPFETVDIHSENNWENILISSFNIELWINDRLDTNGSHASRIKAAGLPLVTFDDRGEGAVKSDLNIVAMAFGSETEYPGKKVLSGTDYLILNPEIKKFQRERTELNKVIVSMGGSDTYGLTPRVAGFLAKKHWDVTLICGPGFSHNTELAGAVSTDMHVMKNVPSLVEAFHSFDLAITAGGLTPIEANAAGLPCIVIASEEFEIPVAKGLEATGASLYAGYRDAIDETVFGQDLDLMKMSRAGLDYFSLTGVSKVADEILVLTH